MKKFLLIIFLATSLFSQAQTQALSEKYAPMLTIPKGYVCYRTTDAITIDGQADELSWQKATPTDLFIDISGEHFPQPYYHTTAKMLWDDNYLYIYAEMEEPHIWANLQQRDTIVYYDNDFEVFIDPRGEANNYFEIETNAIGTIFDLFLERAYRAPRRPFIQFQWNTPGLKLATHCNGTINNSTDTDIGWSVEMAIPREAIASEFDNYLRAGHWLRINFSRVQWQHELDADGNYSRKKDANGQYLPEDNWVWSPSGQIAMHMPERWGYLYLSDQEVGQGTDEFHYPDTQLSERFLWMLFYAQEEQYRRHRSYHKNLSDFGLHPQDYELLPDGYEVLVETTSHTYEITATAPNGKQYVIDYLGNCFVR